MTDNRKQQRAETNELFQSFLHCSSEEAEQVLSRLILEQAMPIVRQIVQYKLQGSRNITTDREDLNNDIVLELLDHVRQLRNSEGNNPIQSFRDYVAVVAYNACHRYFRQKYPQREAVKNRLRYILKKDSDLAIWNHHDVLICGQSEWSGREDFCTREELQKLQNTGPVTGETRDQLKTLFRSLGKPARLNDLVDHFDQLQNCKESESVYPSQAANTDLALLYRMRLESVWKEIQELPVKQRVALLLSLKDEQGEAALIVFPSTGIASARKIAETLQMPAEELAAFWEDLPMDDLRIAGILGITRQQVINLRKCARERLTRRLARSQ